jgi:hypothetical protein
VTAILLIPRVTNNRYFWQTTAHSSHKERLPLIPHDYQLSSAVIICFSRQSIYAVRIPHFIDFPYVEIDKALLGRSREKHSVACGSCFSLHFFRALVTSCVHALLLNGAMLSDVEPCADYHKHTSMNFKKNRADSLMHRCYKYGGFPGGRPQGEAADMHVHKCLLNCLLASSKGSLVRVTIHDLVEQKWLHSCRSTRSHFLACAPPKETSRNVKLISKSFTLSRQTKI